MQWIEWTRCPQCGLRSPRWSTATCWPSTDGPVEHVHVRCVAKHRFVMPVVSLATTTRTCRPAAPQRELVRVRAPRAGDSGRC